MDMSPVFQNGDYCSFHSTGNRATYFDCSYRISDAARAETTFYQQDAFEGEPPTGPFDLVTCRYA